MLERRSRVGSFFFRVHSIILRRVLCADLHVVDHVIHVLHSLLRLLIGTEQLLHGVEVGGIDVLVRGLFVGRGAIRRSRTERSADGVWRVGCCGVVLRSALCPQGSVVVELTV